jgi:WD40 repeat protein
MTDLLRQKLCDIVAAHGPAVADDLPRCGELLRQAMPEDGAGVMALVRALEARVPARLALLTEPLSLAPLTSGLVRRLVEEQGLSEEAARWAVESWAVALGKGDVSAPAFAGRFPGYEHVLAPPRRRRRLPWVLLALVTAVATAAGGWWWLGQRSEVRRISGHTEGVYCLALSPDGRTAMGGCGDKSLRVWDVATGAELKRFEGHQAPPSALTLSPDGRLALSCGGQVLQQGGKFSAVDCVVRAWDLGRGQGHAPFGMGFKVTEAALESLKAAGVPERVRAKLAQLKDKRFDTTQDFLGELTKLLRRDELAGGAHLIAQVFAAQGLAPAGAPLGLMSQVLVTSKVATLNAFALDELERHRNAILGHTSVEGYDGPIYHVAFSPDGRLALACMGWWEYKEAEYVVKDRKSVPADCVVRLYDVATGQQVRKLEGHKNPVWCAAFTPDSRRVVSGGMDGTVRLWDAASGQELRRVELPGKPHVICLAVSRDGRHVLTGDEQSRLRLWRLDDLELLEEQARSEPVRSVAFSPDGSRALSGGDDHLVRLWQTEGLTELRHFPGHSRPVTDVAFLPDGQYALSASTDGTIRVWRLPP